MRTSNIKPQASKIIIPSLVISHLSLVILFVVCSLLLIVSPVVAQSGTIADPMSIGVGARALGMGRAYVGVAEDGDSLFVNPAGIALSATPKLSSMYASLLNENTYAIVSGVYPYGDRSSIGVGIINSSSPDIPLLNTNGSSAGLGNWNNTVMLLSGGTRVSGLVKNKDVLLGASFKYFSVGGTGKNDVADILDSSGTGYSADLGLLVPATEYLTLGANYQNVLSSKLTRSSGINEDIPPTLKLGAKLSLIGKEGQSYTTHSTRRLYLNTDYDLNKGIPNVAHLGVEFWPMSNLALRAGMDGENPTAGLGVRISGIEVNYAYHPFSGIADATTHFVSIGYLGENTKRELRVKFDQPLDKTVVYDDHVKISGKVEVIESSDAETPSGPISLKINGTNLPLAADNSFSAEVPVDAFGKKLVLVEVSDTAGDYRKEEVRLVRLTSFADVPDGYWAKQPIENNATVGLIEGYPDQTFRPENPVTRAELATLLVRAKGIKIPEGSANKVFKDVKPDFWAAKYIEIAQNEGLIKGYPDRTFRPNNKISKVEGIVVMARFDQLRLAEIDAKPFWDVPSNHWAVKHIQAAKDAGMLKFAERNRLRPKEALVRAESVDMLGKTAVAGGRIKDLFTWEKGFGSGIKSEERPQIKASLETTTLASNIIE